MKIFRNFTFACLLTAACAAPILSAAAPAQAQNYPKSGSYGQKSSYPQARSANKHVNTAQNSQGQAQPGGQSNAPGGVRVNLARYAKPLEAWSSLNSNISAGKQNMASFSDDELLSKYEKLVHLDMLFQDDCKRAAASTDPNAFEGLSQAQCASYTKTLDYLKDIFKQEIGHRGLSSESNAPRYISDEEAARHIEEDERARAAKQAAEQPPAGDPGMAPAGGPGQMPPAGDPAMAPAGQQLPAAAPAKQKTAASSKSSDFNRPSAFSKYEKKSSSGKSSDFNRPSAFSKYEKKTSSSNPLNAQP